RPVLGPDQGIRLGVLIILVIPPEIRHSHTSTETSAQKYVRNYTINTYFYNEVSLSVTGGVWSNSSQIGMFVVC
ncbi:MAG: hypothetical protein VZR00_11015, partial [Lachnospiraceae bacterium]|nr:hypothetical protein [Lachnospiraceae bacterium]